MNLFNMCQHVAFLVESYPATGNWTNVGLIVGMYALMREKFAHAFEDLHACALDIAWFRTGFLVEVLWDRRKIAAFDHLPYYWEVIRNLFFIALCHIYSGLCSTSLWHVVYTFAMALEQSECFQWTALLNMVDNEVIAIRNVHMAAVFSWCVEHV